MQDLKKQLNNLKEIKPSASFKENNRRILLAQISNETEPMQIGIFSFLSQPAWAVFCIIFTILAGGVASAYTTINIKPDNSLFIARVLSERAQIAITFDKEKKQKLDMRLAQNRVKETTEIMADSGFDHNDNKKVQKLAINFKKDVNIIKERLQEINKIKEDKIILAEEEDIKVFMMNAGREETGTDFVEIEEKINPITVLGNENIASTTEEEISSEDNINNTIEKIEDTFEAREYDEFFDALDEVDAIIDNIEDKGTVNGVSTDINATSTE